jgi:hypothetical protein
MGKPRNLAVDIIRLREEGKTYDQIKAVLKCSKATISYHLGEGQQEKLKERTVRYKDKINSFIKSYKAATPCVDCGHNFNYYVMQFDHLPQYIKNFNISNFSDYTRDVTKVIEEMKKCDLVCANCHAERSHQRRLEKAKTKKDFLELLESGLE